MYESIHIQNFRGLKDLKIENLGRVNLLVGANNVGKTSVLEALALLHVSTDPRDVVKIASRRQSWPFGVPKTLFSTLAFQGDWTRKVQVRAEILEPIVDHSANILNLSTNLDAFPNDGRCYVSHRQISIRAGGTLQATGLILALAVNDRSPNEFSSIPQRSTTVDPEDRTATHEWDLSPFAELNAVWSDLSIPDETLALLYAPINRAGRADAVLQFLKGIDPRIERILSDVDEYDSNSLSTSRIPQPVLTLMFDSGQTGLPPALLGGGSHRVLRIGLEMLATPGGIVVVDEFDLGIHYKRLEALWSQTGRVARDLDIQLFATTHSLECIEAAVRAFEGERESDLRVIRLERVDGEVQAVDIEYDQVSTLFDLALEFR